MKDVLLKLTRLQKTDSTISEFEKHHTQLKSGLSEVQQACHALQSELDRQKQDLAEVQLLRRQQESELKASEEMVGRSKSRLSSVKNAKEYMAIQRELEVVRKDTTRREEDTIRLLDAEKANEARIADREEKLAILVKQVEEQERDVNRRVEELDGNLGALREKLQDLSKALPRTLMKKYERIRERRDGVAVIMVSRFGICQGCNMAIPPQLFNELQRVDRIDQCPSCNRIMYWEGMLDSDEAITSTDLSANRPSDVSSEQKAS